MSKMSKDFKVKSALRCMADGGMLGGAQNALRGRDAAIAQAENAAVKPGVPPPVVTPQTAPVPVNGMISDGVVSRPAPAAAPTPAPQPGMFSRLRKMVGMANGGSPWDSSYAPGGSLSMQKATPRAQPTIVLGGAPANPVAQPAATPSPAAEPSPALAPPVSSTPTGGTHSIATANLQFGNGTPPPVGNWAGNPQTSAAGYPVLRGGGAVRGPGGPREDKVGPVMLSNKEYVLPAKTVEAMGGPEELDEIVQATNDGRPPHGVDKREEKGEKHGLRGYAVGGTGPIYVDADGNVRPDPVGRQVPRAAPPPVNPGVPATAPQPSPFPERDITPPKIEAEVVRNPAPAQGGGALRGVANQISKRVNSGAGNTIGLAAAGTAADAVSGTETDDYYRRFGINPKAAAMTTDIKTGKQIDKTPLERLGSDLVARSMGAASDLGNAFTANQLGKHIFRDKTEPVAEPAQPKNMWARDARDVAPESVLRQEASDSALARAQQLMDRNTPDTGGAIVRMGNTFAGGVGGEQGKQMENDEAAKARARYANDAQGMYAAIQGHIANGDLETANQLAWDSTSRSLVNQGYAARQAARQAAAQPNEMDAINSRYDKQAEKLSKYFRSDAAKGNLAKHLVNLEERRALEVGALRNTQATMRGNDIAAQSNAAKIASDQAIANQRNAMDWRKTMMEQTNKDREFGLNNQKFGVEKGRLAFDQGMKREETNQKVIDAVAPKYFPGQDGKGDPAAISAFSQFLHSSQGHIFDLEGEARDRALASAANKFKIMIAANDPSNKQYFTGKTSGVYNQATGTGPATMADVVDGGLAIPSYIGAKVRERTIGNGDVVRYANGQVRSRKDLNPENSQEIDDELYRNSPLRKK